MRYVENGLKSLKALTYYSILDDQVDGIKLLEALMCGISHADCYPESRRINWILADRTHL